jgi:transposase
MTQADRDRLVTLRKAKKRLITQREAARELDVSVRQVKRLLKALRERGDKTVIHGLRGRPSNHRVEKEVREEAERVLSLEVYRGFRPTLASEYLARKHGIKVSRETVRGWMRSAGLWRAKKQRIQEAHLYRPRRSRCGELVQWDTSEHDWLEGRGSMIYLIAMIDDATSRLYGRFVSRDSTEENMRTLWLYLERYGRPLAFYTDKASLFRTAPKTARDEKDLPRDEREPLPPTQIGRALRELDIVWIPAHSPQAKGRVERGFRTAQDRLVKGLRVAGARTLEQANAYLETEFLPWWNGTLTVKPNRDDDAHRKLDRGYDLPSMLCHVATRQVGNDYTLQFESKRYQIERTSIGTGLRGGKVRVERRLDGTIAVRFGKRYLAIAPIVEPTRAAAPVKSRSSPQASHAQAGKAGKSPWMKNFSLRRGPTVDQAIAISNATR